MSKTTCTTPHSWPLITVGATVFECVCMLKQLRLSDSIDFSSREELQPEQTATEIYTCPHIHVNDHTNNICKLILNVYAFTFSGFSLKHTHMHIHYPLCERVYRSLLGPILLWCLTFSLHQSCETNPLSHTHTHAVNLKACL